ncbi:MAG: acetyl-CoA carboxylase biotin carboxyl carrier protein [Leptolyngbyaceae cyanobacterium RM2_2_4]|nr:acetyl-CoA carboxylase biotin carboxyl carrier protein [Leptolyngbyaceae cyanobacterium SM1_4_3]NJN89697.1 acetyl-CoA carboxylase biotin carboxyl carrier protein [Leptolyngbyaceae cyanobacterium SL_5_14]NJO53192.1 acetyl-CoA carboxylase biotin carboxyl carrier protein [Leptolyngbyaceae cyanobacterium RM2_2_4]
MEFDFNELRQLLAVLNQTDIAELTLKSDDFELVVRKGIQLGDRPQANSGSGVDSTLPAAVLHPQPPNAVATTTADVSITASVPTPASTPPASDRLVEIMSPMVGTFYRAPGPDESPFVEVGDRIRPGQTVCIIEAMKLMNELEAEVSGEIVEILVQNGEPVEYGQPLIRVNPG